MSKGAKKDSWSQGFALTAVLAAIMLLLAREGQGMAEYGSGSWQVLRIYEGLTCWSIPALFMVWGMQALEEGKPGLNNTIKGLVLPCISKILFWGTLYATVQSLLGGKGVSVSGVLEAMRVAACGGTYFHLWVLYPLLGLCLLQPMIHRFTATADRNEVFYFLMLCMVFASLLPVWEEFHPDGVLVKLLQRMQVHMVLGYVGYYIAGWYLCRYAVGRFPEFLIYGLGIVGMVFTLLGHEILGGDRDLWYSYTAPGVALTAVAVCSVFRYVLGAGARYVLGKHALGVYLFHQIWVLALQWLGYSVLTWSPVVSVPVLAAGVFLISMPFVWLLHRIPGAGRGIIA